MTDRTLPPNIVVAPQAAATPSASSTSDEVTFLFGHEGHNVLHSLGQKLPETPRVMLREAPHGDSVVVQPQSSEVPSKADSKYQLHGEIARGGMGAILKGRDTDLNRDLAIKVLLESHKDNPDVVQRFIEEAQIGGQLQHPGIVPVYELGQFADERPYFSRKLVKGQTLAALLTERQTPADDRARFLGVFNKVCETMAYAHSRGVIHRDLKPANIMVGAFGEVQVMDWGLAKVLNAGGMADEKKAHQKQDVSVICTLHKEGSNGVPIVGSHTLAGSVMGTPAYMAPEQALGEVDRLDERTDVFGLGAILCEILTGAPPYTGKDGTEVFRLATRGKLDDCHARLESCGAEPDLIELAWRCLAPEPEGRPRNAGAVADRISAYLASVESRLRTAEVERAAEAARAEEALHTAAEARLKTRAERRARRLQLGFAALIVSATAVAGIAAAWSAMYQSQLRREAIRAERTANKLREAESKERERAEFETARAQAEKIRSDNMLADMQTERGLQAGRDGQPAVAALWFANAAAVTPHDPARQAANQLRAASWLNESLVPAAVLKLPEGDAQRMSFQPGGPLALTVSGYRLRVWDWRNEQALFWSESVADVCDAAWSPDGRQLAVGYANGDVKIFDPFSGDVLRQLRHAGAVNVLRWSPDGSRLAVGGPSVEVWNLTAEPTRDLNRPHPRPVYGVNFNRAGTRLVTACEDQQACVFALDDESLTAPLYGGLDHAPHANKPVATPVFCDGDRKLVTILEASRQPALWDAVTGQRVATEWKHVEYSDRTLDVSPDGRWIAVAGGKACLLVNVDGTSIVLEHHNHLHSAVFSPGGQSLATLGFEGLVRIWPTHKLDPAMPPTPVVIPQQSTFADGVYSSDGALAIASNRHVVVWERRPSNWLVGRIGWLDHSWRPRPSFDGRLVAPGMLHEYYSGLPPRSSVLSVARMADGEPAGPTIPLDGLLYDSCICADNRSVAAASVSESRGILAIHDVVSGKPIVSPLALPDLPLSVSARPGRPQVAVLCQNAQIQIIDTTQGTVQCDWSEPGAAGNSSHSRVAYSPDGAALAFVSTNDQVFNYDAETGKLRYPPLQPKIEGGLCRSIAFSPDSRLLATAVTGRNMVQVWDLATGAKVGPGMPHPGDAYALWSVAFSPDGMRMLTGHKDGRARVWDWKTGQMVGSPMQHSDEVSGAQFTPDGRHVIGCVRQNTIYIWDVATGKLAVPLQRDLVPVGGSTKCLAIAGDRLIVSAENRYSVLDLGALLEKPRDDGSMLLARAELTTNHQLQQGELVPLDQPDWTARWERLVAQRETPEAAVKLLALDFEGATTYSLRRAIAARAAIQSS
jgi:WD40 repeat protein/serine/threonine protein kinase